MSPTNLTTQASRPSASATSSKHQSFHDALQGFLHKHKTDLSTVASIVQHFQDIITASPFSFLAPILVILNQLLSTITNAFENHDDGRVLASQVSECINMVEKYYNCSDDHSLRALQDEDITKCIDSLKQAHEEAAKVAGRRSFSAFFHASENKAKLEKTSQEIDRLKIEFILKMVLAITQKLNGMHADPLKDETCSSSKSSSSTPPVASTAQHPCMLAHKRSTNPVARMVNPPVCGVAGRPNVKTSDQTQPQARLSMPVPQVSNPIHKGIRMPEPEFHHHPSSRYYY